MNLRDWWQSSDSSESPQSLQGLSSSASCSAPTTPMSKRKSSDANYLGVYDPKQIRLHAYPVSMFESVACRASHFIELPCQTSFCPFFYYFVSLLSAA